MSLALSRWQNNFIDEYQLSCRLVKFASEAFCCSENRTNSVYIQLEAILSSLIHWLSETSRKHTLSMRCTSILVKALSGGIQLETNNQTKSKIGHFLNFRIQNQTNRRFQMWEKTQTHKHHWASSSCALHFHSVYISEDNSCECVVNNGRSLTIETLGVNNFVHDRYHWNDANKDISTNKTKQSNNKQLRTMIKLEFA